MINILYSGNFYIFDGILSSVLSILKSNKGQINIHFLTMDLTDGTEETKKFKPITEGQRKIIEELLKKVNNKSNCYLHDLSNEFKKDKQISIAKRYTPYALLRLYASKVSALPDKLLYLDTDTLVLGSLDEICNTNIDDYEVAMCKDYFGKLFFGRNYCNSGVLLMNMKKIKETQLLEKVRDLCIKKNYFMADQTAINKCVTSRLILPAKYNSQRRINKDTIIRHYCASWRFFPVIRTKNVKQWDVEKVLRDKKNVYNNEYVTDVLNEYMKTKRLLNL